MPALTLRATWQLNWRSLHRQCRISAFTDQQLLWNTAHTRRPIDITRSVAIETWETCLLTRCNESWDRSQISHGLSQASQYHGSSCTEEEPPLILYTKSSFLGCVIICQEVTEQQWNKKLFSQEFRPALQLTTLWTCSHTGLNPLCKSLLGDWKALTG